MLTISKEVICGTLRDVERLATGDFERAGYTVIRFVDIQDLGYTTRRLWRVTAEVERKEG